MRRPAFRTDTAHERGPRWLFRACLFAWIGFLHAPAAVAQQQDTLEATLPEVRMEAARLTETQASAPFAVSVLSRSPEELKLEPGLSLTETLNALPGVWLSNRSHFAMGERLMIRGMGWRSAFGVRGVQVLLDGVPLTMPDGQSVLDIVDPALVRRAEVVRGPASVFWGNASGGVLFLTTAPTERAPAARARFLAGSYGARQVIGEATITPGRHLLHAYVSDARQNGFRAYSEGRFTRAGLHSNLNLGSRTQVKLTGALVVLDTEHPGSLTAEQVLQNRRMASSGYVATQSGKESTQGQVGATLLHQNGLGTLTGTAWGQIRDLANPLPFAYIDLYRKAGGARASQRGSIGAVDWGIGVDGGYMSDDRKNMNNEEGQPGADLSVDQREDVSNVAAFASATAHLTERLAVTGGLRADRIRFSLSDHLLDDGDQTGTRLFSAWSPSIGVGYQLPSRWIESGLLFANYGTAFETPTTTELVNSPDGSAGFNPELRPQYTRGVEVGARGSLPAARLRFDLAVYRMNISNGIVPYQAGGSDRAYYRNTGENLHEGVEVALRYDPIPTAGLDVSYTLSRLVLREDSLRGNQVPGVPEHRLFAAVRFSPRPFWSRLSVEAVSAYPVDNANEVTTDGYATLDLDAGLTGLRLGSAAILPFFRIGNILDARYNGSVVVNSDPGRYFEPAPGRTFQAGVNVQF
ncbi:MAG TPA: TonB-dependent receptor [Rhodothermales bacterium]|nr:TonB-dependent receptor [Rhodothermales bacterium]